jgi:hypothetical protein
MPDASGQNSFTSALLHGVRDEVVVAALLASDEYFNALL